MEKLRAANAASQAQQLASGSVHASCQLSEAELMDRTRRLYEDGLQRLERLEVARQQNNQQRKDQAPRRSVSSGPSRFEMLYSDASRREEDRRHLQERHERDELEMCRLQLQATPRRASTARRSSTPRGTATPREVPIEDVQAPRTEPARALSEVPLARSSTANRSDSPSKGRNQQTLGKAQTSAAEMPSPRTGGTPSATTARARTPPRTEQVIATPAAEPSSERKGAQPCSSQRARTPPRSEQARPTKSLGGTPRARTPPSQPAKVVTPSRTRVEPKAGAARPRTPPPKRAVTPPKRDRTPSKGAQQVAHGAQSEPLRPERKAMSKSSAIRTGAWP